MVADKVLKLVRRNELLYGAAQAGRDIYCYLRGVRRGTFSQHGEDIFISEHFGHKKGGFYVDVGASHPFRLSNTFLLYQNGWRGVTVEPIPFLANLHKKWRPQDTLVQRGIGPFAGKRSFQEMLPSVLSTLDAKIAEAYVSKGRAHLLRSYDIDVLSLDELFANYVGRRPVDLLSIDIEGLDTDTITAFELNDVRPVVICIEANSKEDRDKVLSYLEQCEYRLLAEFGCNLIVENTLS
jgi:hypothetical protein